MELDFIYILILVRKNEYSNAQDCIVHFVICVLLFRSVESGFGIFLNQYVESRKTFSRQVLFTIIYHNSGWKVMAAMLLQVTLK